MHGRSYTKPEYPTLSAPSWISFQSVWKKRDYYLVQHPNTNLSGESPVWYFSVVGNGTVHKLYTKQSNPGMCSIRKFCFVPSRFERVHCNAMKTSKRLGCVHTAQHRHWYRHRQKMGCIELCGGVHTAPRQLCHWVLLQFIGLGIGVVIGVGQCEYTIINEFVCKAANRAHPSEINYRPQTNLREGNIFTPVCHSVLREKDLPPHNAMGQADPPPPHRHTPPLEGRPPSEGSRLPQVRSTGGWYESYWNAYFFQCDFWEGELKFEE